MTVPRPIVTTQKANAIRQSNNSANQLIRNPPCTLYIATAPVRGRPTPFGFSNDNNSWLMTKMAARGQTSVFWSVLV
jgi:hypothetical protein